MTAAAVVEKKNVSKIRLCFTLHSATRRSFKLSGRVAHDARSDELILDRLAGQQVDLSIFAGVCAMCFSIYGLLAGFGAPIGTRSFS